MCVLNSFWSTAIVTPTKSMGLFFAYVSLDNSSVLAKGGHVRIWVSQKGFRRQRIHTSNTARNIMIYCMYCIFFPHFLLGLEKTELLERFLKYSFMIDMVLSLPLRTAITRISRTVLVQNPTPEINLTVPHVLIYIYFTKLSILWLLNVSTFQKPAAIFCGVSHSALQLDSSDFRRKNRGEGKNKKAGNIILGDQKPSDLLKIIYSLYNRG